MTVSCSLTSFEMIRCLPAHASRNPPPPRAPHWSRLWSPKNIASTTILSPPSAPPPVSIPVPVAVQLIPRSESMTTHSGSGDSPPPVDLKVTAATKLVLNTLGITTRDKLIAWRQENGEKGMLSRSPFFGMVKKISSTHWNTLVAPKYSCAAAYERALSGYKIYRK